MYVNFSTVWWRDESYQTVKIPHVDRRHLQTCPYSSAIKFCALAMCFNGFRPFLAFAGVRRFRLRQSAAKDPHLQYCAALSWLAGEGAAVQSAGTPFHNLDCRPWHTFCTSILLHSDRLG